VRRIFRRLEITCGNPHCSWAWRGLLTLAFRKNRARVRHGIWLAASCKFLFPLSALVALGGQVRWRTAEEHPFQFRDGRGGRPEIGGSGNFAAHASRIVFDRDASCSRGNLDVRFCGDRVHVVDSLGGASGVWCASVRPCLLLFPLRAVSSSVLAEPGVFGLFRPVLILPEDICERLTGEQLDAVIAHEMCHVGHRDNLTAALHMAVETVFWFHPLVW
jgi:bla regulator protein BlaR1